MKVVYILLKLYLRFFLFNDQIKGQCQVCAYNICVENRVCKDEKKKKKKELMEFFSFFFNATAAAIRTQKLHCIAEFWGKTTFV